MLKIRRRFVFGVYYAASVRPNQAVFLHTRNSAMAKKNQHAVKIIAGSLKGRRLSYPAQKILRPTMQRTRESLFDSIGDRIAGGVFVDLFAAAGGVGIEAMSRGAYMVHFVENHPVALEFLQKNIEACGVPVGAYRIHRTDVKSFLEGGVLKDEPVRIVFADPPYGEDHAGTVVAHFEKNIYPHIESLILEHRGTAEFDVGRWLRVEKTRRFGDTFLTFLEPCR